MAARKRVPLTTTGGPPVATPPPTELCPRCSAPIAWAWFDGITLRAVDRSPVTSDGDVYTYREHICRTVAA